MLTDDERKTIEHAARMLADEAYNKRRTIHAAVFGHTHADTLDSLAAKLRAIAAPRTAPSPTPDAAAAIERAATWIELGELGGTPDAVALVATLREFVRKPRVATVGELLATAHVIEARTVFGWHQMRDNGDQRAWSVKTSTWSEWGEAFHAEVSFRESTLPARLVTADQADADPSTRGPIGEE